MQEICGRVSCLLIGLTPCGLTLTFNVSGQTSTLNNIIIGAPNEVIFQTIDIGTLIEPRNNHPFANSPALHLDYYQKIPVSRLIVGEYESVHFNRVVLPNGSNLYDLICNLMAICILEICANILLKSLYLKV